MKVFWMKVRHWSNLSCSLGLGLRYTDYGQIKSNDLHVVLNLIKLDILKKTSFITFKRESEKYNIISTCKVVMFIIKQSELDYRIFTCFYS